jgi:hypothetical protein
MTQPAQQPGVFGQSAGAYNAALGQTAQAAAGPNIGAFMNPFTQNVTNRAIGDIGAAQNLAMQNLGAQASRAGAFGGSRHGVAEGATNSAFIKQMADTSANMNMQGFNTALGAAQNQQGMNLAAGGQFGNLANMGFGFGSQIGQQQMQQGSMQQGILQSIIDAARGQYGGFTGAPMQSLQAPLAALGAANMGQQSQTQSQKPGLFNYLSLGLGLL